jgi:hypothetical protein
MLANILKLFPYTQLLYLKLSSTYIFSFINYQFLQWKKVERKRLFLLEITIVEIIIIIIIIPSKKIKNNNKTGRKQNDVV